MIKKTYRYETDVTLINEHGVQHWGQGKELSIVYILETTKHDAELEEINFSNLHEITCDSLEEMFSILNSWQREGYKNINVRTNVNQKENVEGLQHNTLIEDCASDIDITVNTKHQEETNKRNNQLQKVIASQEEEIELYESFIERYNSQKLFESYIENKDKENVCKRGLHWYEYRLRGFSLGCQPKGHIKHDETKGRFGIIAYDRQLTDKEISDYELQPYKVS